MTKTTNIRSVHNAEDLIGYFAAKLGWDGTAKEVSNKTYFYNPNHIVHQLLAHFGIAPDRVMIRVS